MCSLVHELQMHITFVKYCFPLLLKYGWYTTATNLNIFMFQTVSLFEELWKCENLSKVLNNILLRYQGKNVHQKSAGKGFMQTSVT
jgi:hypothetical protein